MIRLSENRRAFSVAASANGRFLAVITLDQVKVFDLESDPIALRQEGEQRAAENASKLQQKLGNIDDRSDVLAVCNDQSAHMPTLSSWADRLEVELGYPAGYVVHELANELHWQCDEMAIHTPTTADREVISELAAGGPYDGAQFAALQRIQSLQWANSTHQNYLKFGLPLLLQRQSEEDARPLEIGQLLHTLESMLSEGSPAFSSDLHSLGRSNIELGVSDITEGADMQALQRSHVDTFSDLAGLKMSIGSPTSLPQPMPAPVRPATPDANSPNSNAIGGSASPIIASGNAGSVVIGGMAVTPSSTAGGANAGASVSIAPPVRIVPVRDELPRDALYVRRNNQFGTKAPRIKESLARGVLVDQEVITFDDFIGLASDGVPLPNGDEAVRISVGVSAIRQEFTRDKSATHHVEIILRTALAPPEGIVDVQTAGNYVFVVDASGSMEGEPLDIVKETIASMFKDLTPEDSLGIVAFSDGVNTILENTRVKNLKPEALRAALGSLHAEGGTDLNLGIGYGFDELGRFDAMGRSNHLVVLSDGEPTSGEKDWFKIRRSLAGSVRETPAQVLAFAIGSGANFSELDSLVGASGGRAEAIVGREDIQAIISEEVARQRQLAAMDIQVRLALDPSVGLRYFYGHEPITDPARKNDLLAEAVEVRRVAEEELNVDVTEDLLDEDGIRVFVPNLSYGETYILLLEVQLPKSVVVPRPVLEINAQYVDVAKRQFVEFGPNVITDVDQELTSRITSIHALKLASSEIAFSAISDIAKGNRSAAVSKLRAHADRLGTAAGFFDADMLRDDRVTLRKFSRLISNLGTRRVTADVGVRGQNSGVLQDFSQQVIGMFAIGNINYLRASFVTYP